MKIGWIIPSRRFFSSPIASTRLRVYDIIRYLREKGVKGGIYSSFERFDIVVFQKSFSPNHLHTVQKLRTKGVKTILDINVNYIDTDNEFVTETQQKNIKLMLKEVNAVITPSPYLRKIYANFNKNTYLIEEIIEERFLKVKKRHSGNNGLSLLFCGYAVKAKELYLIKDILRKLHKKYHIKLVFICEKDPKLEIIPYEFYKYNHKRLPFLLIKGDIKISPRDLERKYNLGHSFTRIGYPMAVGLPVAATPVPSYLGSPAVFCVTSKEWESRLEELIVNADLRKDLEEKGQQFVRDNFARNIIIDKYMRLFSDLIRKV